LKSNIKKTCHISFITLDWVRNHQYQLKQQQYRYIDDKFGKEEMEGSLKCLNIIHLDRKLPRETNGLLPLLDIIIIYLSWSWANFWT
jgi:hypothetical protein